MKITGFDYPCMDMNVLCSHMPQKDELTVMEDFSLMGGGKVANAIAAVMRLGGTAAFIGRVGEDRYGRLCRKDLQDHGVDVENLKIGKGHTSLCISIVDSLHRDKHYIESPATTEPLAEEEIPYGLLKETDYFLLYQFDEIALKMAAYVREHGGKVVADGDGYDDRTQKNLGLIDVFILSEYYYDSLFGDADYEKNLKLLSTAGPQIVIVTLGVKGCAGIENGRFFFTEAYCVEVKDTTGAGDVFHGAFVFGLSEGMEAKEAASFAASVSAVKCTVLGGRTGIPDRGCVEHYRRTGEISPCDFAKREQKYRRDAWN